MARRRTQTAIEVTHLMAEAIRKLTPLAEECEKQQKVAERLLCRMLMMYAAEWEYLTADFRAAVVDDTTP